MTEQSTNEGLTARVARHRTRTLAAGSRRVEVTVAACDAVLIRAVARTLRAGGEDARRVRDALTSMTPPAPAQTGADLVAFLRASPLVGEDLVFERDRSTGRVADLE